MSGDSLLSVVDLSGGYGDITVVKDFMLELAGGNVACVTGRNGVGKTTLARLVTGSLLPASGQVRFAGQDVTSIPAHRRRAIGMGNAPQEAVVFDNLTVGENLSLHHRGRSLDRYAELFLKFPRIRDRLTQSAGTLSGGEKKILSFCRALAEDTKLVILDEPSEGVQPENIDLMVEIIQQRKDDGRAFLIVEQNLTMIEAIADSAYLIDHGECTYSTSKRPDLRLRLSERLRI